MKQDGREQRQPGQRPGKSAGKTPTDPFGTWLERGLRELYEPIMREPIPQELLDLIEFDQPKPDGKGKPASGDPTRSDD